jgi:DNA repair exonuclease SbcCD ATPase subunit
MRPLALRLLNVGPFPQLEWAIPDGICAISGPNGAGKSTLIGAIELALFANGSRDLAPKLGPFGDRLEIELMFDHEGDTYRVRRGFKKGKATVDFEIEQVSILPGTEYLPLTRETAKETDALICKTTGLTRRLFNASAYLAQENSGAFTRADPAERKAVLGEALDPGELWPRLYERARAESKALEGEMAVAQAKIDEREETAASAPLLDDLVQAARNAQATARREHDEREQERDQASAKLAANDIAYAHAKAAEQAHHAAALEVDRVRLALNNAQGAGSLLFVQRTRYDALASKVDAIPALEQAVEQQRRHAADVETARQRKQDAERNLAIAKTAVERAASDQAALNAELDDVNSKRSTLLYAPPGTHECALCHQLLGAQAKDASLVEYDSLISRLLEQYASKTREVGAVRQREHAAREALDAIPEPEPVNEENYAGQLAEARQAAQERAALEVTIAQYEQAAERVPALSQDVGVAELALSDAAGALLLARDELGDHSALEHTAAETKRAVTEARARLDAANAAAVRAEGDLERANQAATELAQLREQTSEQHKRLDALRNAERAYHRDGIPALIAENIVPTLEAEANRILERLPTSSGTVFRVELRTQRELKSSDGLKETLDILVSDRATTREFGTFSGGERFRVSFALRWALAKLLRNRRGARSDVLVIDEPDGLDAGGMDGLAAILREEAGSFASVLLVSHSPLLAEAFEQIVVLKSDGEVSRMVADLVLA